MLNDKPILSLIAGVLILLILFFGGRYLLVKIKQNQQAETPRTTVEETMPKSGTNFTEDANVLKTDIPAEKFVPGSNDSAEKITIYTGTNVGKPKLMNGFVHGITYDPSVTYDKTIELISALRPRSIRLGNESNNVYGFVVNRAKLPQRVGTKIVLNVQTPFSQRYGYTTKLDPNCVDGNACFKTFEDVRNGWKDTLTKVMQEKIKRNLTVDAYEIFAEPTTEHMPLVAGLSFGQLSTLYKDADAIIRSYEPNAVIGGPSLIDYFPKMQEGFLDFIVANNIRLDYIVWHEFHAPEDVLKHAEDNRRLVNARPALCNPTCPKTVIGEFAPPEHLHLPGINVAWFYYLEKAGVDEANRACFDITSPKDTCWMAFNGVLMGDNVTTTDMYWVYRMYADMDTMRVRTDITAPHTVAISDRNDSQKELKVLLGRYGYKGVAGDVKVSVKEYPYGGGKVSAEIWNIPRKGQMYYLTSLANPVKIETQTLDAVNGEITLNIGSFKDGEAYYVIFKPL